MNRGMPDLEAIGSAAGEWADALLRVSVQGGAAILIVWAALHAVRGVPAWVQVWIWRLVFAKIALGLILPVSIAAQRWPWAHDSLMVADGSAVPASLVWPWAVGAMWIAGVIVSIAALAQGLLHVLRLRRAVELERAGDEIRVEAARVARQLGLKYTPEVCVSEFAEAPLVLGAGRPIVLLPRRLADESPLDEVRMVLSHEMAHVRRRDLAWGWLPALVECALFFHPLVWLARRELLVAQDAACDAVALRVCRSSPAAYGRLLLRLTDALAASSRAQRPFGVAAAAAIDGYRSLRRRLQRLADRRAPRSIAALGMLAILPLAAAALPVCRPGPLPEIFVMYEGYYEPDWIDPTGLRERVPVPRFPIESTAEFDARAIAGPVGESTNSTVPTPLRMMREVDP